VILLLIVFSIWVDSVKSIQILNPFNNQFLINRNTDVSLGLDLKGGLQALLQADVPNCGSVDPKELDVTRQILVNRVNAYGVSEVTMQVAGNCRIVAEFPGVSNPEQIISALQQTGLLEFVDMGNNPVAANTTIKTDYNQAGSTQAVATGTVQPPGGTPALTSTPEITPAVTGTPAANATPAATSQPEATASAPATVYHTVMTGADLDASAIAVQLSSVGRYEINFTLKSNAVQKFSDYTGSHVNQYLAIVLDKKVISVPSINSQIPNGQGVIQLGSSTADEANSLANILRYGSLPVPVKVVESQTVGPTLGAESVRKSLLAGAIGLTVVILFMGLYYRLPGVLADLALVTYTLISLMLFKIIPIFLTLPGIAGFILSIGMAVDANVLIFERLKEELRSGRPLRQAIDLGWSRAWPSIRDSNSSTLITCFILYIFGNTFGASMVKGFAINLALGVVISLFTAIIVTRSYLHLVLDNLKLGEHSNWFGL
jgi:preprotein translocase subunit SecD